jgi:arabinogalactan oligomer / maltooligosaccharide transport system substrate-binding protein
MAPTLSYIALLVHFSGCGKPAAENKLLLWHTFNAEETETLGRILPPGVQSVVVPFPRAFNTFRESVSSGTGCPDVFRAEQVWIPALRDLIEPRTFPHSIDGLALIYNRDLVPTPPATMEQLKEVAAAATREGRYGFFVRGDAYWFLPFLYGMGADFASLDSPEAVRALAFYRSLLPYSPPPSSNDYQEQERRFGAGQVAMIINGPWSIAELRRAPAFKDHPDRLGIAPLWATPISGHAYVVPHCARDKAAAFALAERLASPQAQAELARRNGLVPADHSVAVENPFRAALKNGRPRPQHPASVYIFDDFHPAVQAVLRGDAEPREALEGVARAWRRLLR